MRERSALPWRLRTPTRTIAAGLVVNLVAVVACLEGHAAHAAGATEPAPLLRPIEAPHYGDVLFRFYQDQTLGALTTLMVSQHFQRLGQHDDEAEVLRGGLMLAYGMHREAGEVFSRLIERNTAPGVRNRAWFYLAQVRFARGLAEPARDALARIDGPLQPVLEDERQLLQAQVQLALNDPAGAAKALEALATAPGRSATETVATAQAAARSAYNPPPDVTRSWISRVQDWLLQPFRGSDAQVRTQADAQLFARFNLGVALIRGGDAAGGQRWLDELGQMPAANEEQRTLRDRANLALGFGALQRNEPEAARKWLERIRLEGPVSNKALLGFGWAAMALKQPQQALLPWRALVARDDTDAAVMEARIALPFALAELGAEAEALTGYRSALTGFDEEAGRIDASMASLRTGNWLADLLERDAAGEMRWRDPLARVGQLPTLAHGRQLAPVLASHDFQEGFKTWRDLRFLQQNLRDWQAQLSSFSDMLAQRQARFAERLPEVRGEADRRNLAPLQQRLASLQAELS
ncbi:tetratricopeptide repeat protein, partial [Ideonella sp.]|uniref:tetratricopeptide repeat protein n=1 Tax=Ideonella sp. TaxID=1929293 RepID=UPI003BB76928